MQVITPLLGEGLHSHQLPKREHGRFQFIFLTGYLVLVGSQLGFHLCHVGLTLLSHLAHHLGLSERHLTLVAFLPGHLHRTLKIEHIAVSLIDLQGQFVALCLNLTVAHQNAGFGGPQMVQTLETVEDRERRRQGVAVVEGAHIRVGVRLGVDGTSEIILCADVAADGRQEGAYGFRVLCPAAVLSKLTDTDVMVVFHGIAHTVSHCQTCLLCHHGLAEH